MLTRTESGVTYTQTWDEENRLKTVTVNGQTTTYTYDGDGKRARKVQGGQTTVYIGDYYEKNLGTGVVTKYYYAGGQRVAERQGSTVYYFTDDHLGSTSLMTNASGGEVSRGRSTIPSVRRASPAARWRRTIASPASAARRRRSGRCMITGRASTRRFWDGSSRRIRSCQTQGIRRV